jgi:hypothetical protein
VEQQCSKLEQSRLSFATKTQKPDIQVLLGAQGTFNNRVFVM